MEKCSKVIPNRLGSLCPYLIRLAKICQRNWHSFATQDLSEAEVMKIENDNNRNSLLKILVQHLYRIKVITYMHYSSACYCAKQYMLYSN